jgi:xanthine dehydrogenase large subunit
LVFPLRRHILIQAGALIKYLYRWSVLVKIMAGSEMGQGLQTKIRQIVAHEFQLDMSFIKLSATDTR